jgi:hypothetical protein
MKLSDPEGCKRPEIGLQRRYLGFAGVEKHVVGVRMPPDLDRRAAKRRDRFRKRTRRSDGSPEARRRNARPAVRTSSIPALRVRKRTRFRAIAPFPNST